MILDWSKVRMFVKPGATDMRKQINGLSMLVCEDLHMDPFEGNLFLFCNKHRRILKIIYWDKNGFCLWLKRLEKDSKRTRNRLLLSGRPERLGIDILGQESRILFGGPC